MHAVNYYYPLQMPICSRYLVLVALSQTSSHSTMLTQLML